MKKLKTQMCGEIYGDLPEIKNKKRSRVVRDKKKGGVRIKPWTKRRKLRALLPVCMMAILAVGIVSLGSFGATERNEVDFNFVSVAYEVPTDGSTPASHTGIENIGYMNTRLKQQTNWYSEMHSKVSTIMAQTVDTYKQYSNGVMVQSDIAKSDLINDAQQFCWFGDDVIWRSAPASQISAWNGVDSPWKTGKPDAHMKVKDFMEKNGLPGTEFSVYVLREETILSAEDVIDNGDGTYTQTFHLDPAADKAVMYYGNQMVFKGGLSKPPAFSYITVSYTFDAQWQILVCEVEEQYTALKKGIPVPATCVSRSRTEYEYNTPRSQHTAYESYFKQYANDDTVITPEEKELTAAECLGGAFASVLTGPTTFSVSLTVNGLPVEGTVYLDIATMDIRARIGEIYVWYQGDEVYLSYRDIKAKLNVNQLMPFIEELMPKTEGASSAEKDSGGLDVSSILAALGNGDFRLETGYATLDAELDLFGIRLPVHFKFNVGEENAVTLDHVSTAIAVKDFTVGARLAFGDEQLPEVSDTDGYIALTPYIENAIRLFRSEVLNVAVDYKNGELSVAGSVDISTKDGLTASGKLRVAYGEDCLEVLFCYDGKNVYLDAAGIKLRLNAKETVEFVKGLLGGSVGEGISGKQIDWTMILKGVLSEGFGTSFGLTEADGALNLNVKGTQILNVFGVSFELGDVSLSLSENSVRANLLGITATVTKGKAVELPSDTSQYIDVFAYAKKISELFAGEAVGIEVRYETDGLGISGNLTVNTAQFGVYGKLTLSYGEISKTVNVLYEDDEAFVSLDGMKLKLNVPATLDLLKNSFGGQTDNKNPDVAEILKTVVGLDFGKLVQLTEKENSLTLLLKGTELLNAFNVDFALGDVTVSLVKDELRLNALGIAATLKKATAYDAESEEIAKEFATKDEFKDITALVGKIPQIVKAGAVSLRGSVSVDVDGTQAAIFVKQGVISWKNGLELYFDIELDLAGVLQEIFVRADGNTLQFAYGQVGATVRFNELKALDEAFVDLYERIKAVLDRGFESDSPLPENIQSAGDLLKVITKATANANDGGKQNVVEKLLKELRILAPETENGLFALSFKGVTAEILGLTEDSLLGVQLGYGTEESGLKVSGNLSASTAEEVPGMPQAEYLETADFVKMLDYIGAAVETLVEQDVIVSVSGTTVNAADGSAVFQVNGKLLYHAGEKFPFHINTETKDFYFNSDLYANLQLQLESSNQPDDNIYLDVWVLDYNGNGELDFFVSMSRYLAGHAKYKPLKVYAPAGELMTVLASGFGLLGVDVDLANDYFVSKWLEEATVEQLRAFGDMLKKSLGMEDVLNGLFAGASAQASEEEAREAQAFVNAIRVGDTEFTLVLNSEAIFGAEGLNDTAVTVSKVNGENGSRITGVAFANLYAKNATEKTDVTIGISYEKIAEDAFVSPTLDGYFNVSGIGGLLKVVADSVTHREVKQNEIISGEEIQHEYVLNRYYYIEGSAEASVNLFGGIGATIDIIAVSVTIDEDGAVGINIRLKYSGKAIVVVMLNGDTVVDLTIKNGMVYMKRVQTSEQTMTSNKKLANPITLYRAMPLNVFFADIMNQIPFLLNLGPEITSAMAPKEGSEEPTVAETVDYGTAFENFLKGFEFAEKSAKEGDATYTQNSWKLTLNGAALTNNVMEDIVIELVTGKDGYLHGLNVATSMTFGITISLTANLTYRNPAEFEHSEFTDCTVDTSYMLSNAMSKAIREAEAQEWKNASGKYIYVEGQLANVSYMLGDEEIAVQKVVVNKQTGELYADVVLPDLGEHEVKGYTASWDLSGIVSEDGSYRIYDDVTVYAYFTPNRYTVTFMTEEPLPEYGFGGEKVYNDFDGKYYYTLVTTYVYGEGFYLADGSRFTFPEVDEKGMRVEGFYDRAGNAYRSMDDCRNIYADKWLSAKWEKIEYDVTYEINGETFVQKAYYGDAFVCPVSVEREGYTFIGWQCQGAEVSSEAWNAGVVGSAEFKAAYRPNEYTVTLVSEFRIEGFEENNGVWTKEIVYRYGETTSLPSELKYADRFLDGFVFDLNDAEENAVTAVPATVLGDVTLYARWSEIGYDVVFAADGKAVATQNYKHGADMKNLPAVPDKRGYSGAWNVAEGTVVTGPMTVNAVYTANVYTVSVYSALPLAGFVACEKGYVRNYSYEYDNADAVLTLPADYKIAKYDFGGYFTKPNGEGVRVTVIDNGIIDQTELYLNWIDNTVTVTLYSDVRFEGSENTMYDGMKVYRRVVSFNDEYALSKLPSTEKYQQLGWWAPKADGTVQFVTDVRELNGKDVWAVWIENVDIALNDLSQNGVGVGELQLKSFNMKGKVTGGAVFGTMGKKLYALLGVTEKTEATFSVYGKKESQNDHLLYGDALETQADGTFEKNAMTSAKAIGWGGAVYGGVKITKTFSYAGMSEPIRTEDIYCVSFATYTVTYADASGAKIGEVSGIRADCPFVGEDNGKYVDELAPISVPVLRGYTGVWAHTAVTSNMTVSPEYTPIAYGVKFVSAQQLEGWDYDEASKTYYTECTMNYDAEIQLFEGTVQTKTFTVSDADNVFVLPVSDSGWIWKRCEISQAGAKFYSENVTDKIIYKSDVSFTMEGVVYNTCTKDFSDSFLLPTANEITAEGYTFLGWYSYSKTDGWQSVTEVTYSRGKAVETVVEAFWQKTALSIQVKGKKSGTWNYTTTIQVTSVQYEFVGAFMNDQTVQGNFTYHYHIGTATAGVGHDEDSPETSFTWKNSFNIPNSAKVTATLAFVDGNGRTLYSQQAEASCKI